jgi:hypothetical protein
MRRIFLSAAIAATVFAGCKKDREGGKDGEQPAAPITVVTASAPDDDSGTKVAVSGTDHTVLNWKAGDRIYIARVQSGTTLDNAFGLSAFEAATVNGKNATFTMVSGQKPLVAGDRYIACHTNDIGACGAQVDAGALWGFQGTTISQQQTGTSLFAEADNAMFFISAQATATAAGAAFTFNHVASVFEFEIWTDAPADYPSFQINSVTAAVTGSQPFIEEWHYNGAPALSADASAASVVASLRNGNNTTYHALNATHRKLRIPVIWNPAVTPSGNFTFTLRPVTGTAITFTRPAQKLDPGKMYRVQLNAPSTVAIGDTPENPFIVSSAALLAKVGTGADGWGLGKHYRQTANISLSGTWTPIGSYANQFTGSYDGGGYSISGLSITGATGDSQGLFGVIGTGGTVKNLALTVNISGNDFWYGGVAGYNSGTVLNCYVAGSVAGNYSIGGVVGFNEGGTVRNCHSSASVTGTGNFAGGVVGVNEGTVRNCYATGSVACNEGVGGVTGRNNGSGTVQNCAGLNNSISASANGSIGRVVGDFTSGTLTGNYGNTGAMTTGGAAYTPTGSATGKDGANVAAGTSSGQLGNQAFWTGIGYTMGTGEASPWRWGLSSSYPLPVLWFLNSAPSYPAHFIPAITIVTQPQSMTVTAGKITESLSVTASVTQGATLSYQWFGSSTSSTMLVIISGATSSTYALPATLAAGTHWYRCEVSAPGAITRQSNVATVTVDLDGSGTGQPGNPFLVGSLASLEKVGSGTDGWTLAAHYKQIADINATSVANWIPFSTFTGTYDGDGKTISNLKMSGSNAYRGLFFEIGAGGAVRNLRLTGVSISVTGNNNGAVAGRNQGTIDNCTVAGSVTGGSYTGGITGENEGTVKNCTSTATVQGTSYIGGIAGRNAGGTVENCAATGSARSTGSGGVAGGITGANGVSAGSTATVRNCRAAGSVTSDGTNGNAGGVAGANYGSILRCFATGSITSGGISGGIAGANYNSITRCAALNSSIAGASGRAKRIAYNSGGTFSICHASVTTMTHGGVAYTPVNNDAGEDGGTVGSGTSAGQYNNQTWWSGTIGLVFGTTESAPWKWQGSGNGTGGAMPRLWFE